MGALDGHGYSVRAITDEAITYEITAHKRPGRFTVAKKIVRALGSGDNLPIHLTVVVEGKEVFRGGCNLRSGTEAYTIEGVGPHDLLTVTARRS